MKYVPLQLAQSSVFCFDLWQKTSFHFSPTRHIFIVTFYFLLAAATMEEKGYEIHTRTVLAFMMTFAEATGNEGGRGRGQEEEQDRGRGGNGRLRWRRRRGRRPLSSLLQCNAQVLNFILRGVPRAEEEEEKKTPHFFCFVFVFFFFCCCCCLVFGTGLGCSFPVLSLARSKIAADIFFFYAREASPKNADGHEPRKICSLSLPPSLEVLELTWLPRERGQQRWKADEREMEESLFDASRWRN